MAYAIETFDLTKRFPSPRGYRDLILHPFRRAQTIALEDVNIRVRKGELFGLLGPNGAGKTTLMKILCTIVLPTRGAAYVNGYDVTKHGERIRETVGYVVSEERSFYWRLTGRQNLEFFATLDNLPAPEARRRIQNVLELVGLEDEADRMFKDYSTGMRQGMAIARALLTDPELLFMDEPTRSLDPSAAKHLREFIRNNLAGEQKRTVFFATHNLDEAEYLSDRIGIIDHAKIKACGTLEEMTRSYVGRQLYRLRLLHSPDVAIDKPGFLGPAGKVIRLSREPLSNTLLLEVEADPDEGGISGVIETILRTGGHILECEPEESALSRVFEALTGERD
jgi:ABC-2 type transport system ATP-binding protein